METDVTVRIDMDRFPKDKWTSKKEPFYAIDDAVLEAVDKWTRRQLPSYPCTVEIGGYVPAPIMARMVKAMCEAEVVDSLYVHKPRCAVCKVW